VSESQSVAIAVRRPRRFQGSVFQPTGVYETCAKSVSDKGGDAARSVILLPIFRPIKVSKKSRTKTFKK